MRGASPNRLDLLLAAALTVVGEIEVMLGSTGDGTRLVSALALPLTTLPLAVRRTAPLLPLAALAVVLPAQAALGGFLGEQAVTPLAALVIALYSAGRHIERAAGLAGAALAIAVLATARIAFDPAARDAGDVLLTLVYLPVPLLVGRWLHGQSRLRRELERKGQELERQRERNARHAAEEERVRIAADLDATVTDGVAAIVHEARELPGRLAAGDHAAARERLAIIAAGAREALADVRRVLGILRHDRRGAATMAPAPRPPAAVPRRRRAPLEARHERRLDRILAALLLLGAEIELAFTAPSGDLPEAAVTAVPIALPLLWRRHRPIAVAAAVLAAVGVQSTLLGLDRFPVFDSAAVICAAYAVGAYAGRPVAGLVLVVLGSAVHSAVFNPDAIVPAVLGGAITPWVAGRTVRTRRLMTRELHDRAARIERGREQEALAATTAERVRVARELHDAVAHNLSVLAIQAAGADGVVERDPARALQCAELIEGVGRETLAELGRLVDAGAPQPGLAFVDGLTQRAREGGLPVELRVEGDPAALPAGVDLAAYRIVQEALANAAKHAGAARAWVIVRYLRQAVEVEVADDGRGAGGAGSSDGGHGLVGIRERVALYDGTVAIGRRPGGGFLVQARLPV